jgi:adenylate cyclase class IV
MAIEVERRARFDEATYDRLMKKLSKEAQDLGDDDKTLQFYLYEDKLLKIVNNHSKGTAAIALKLTRIGQDTAYRELPQLPLDPIDVPTAVAMFNDLGGFESTHQAFNRRHNFMYAGIEIAVKWSEAWGYHAEFEILLDDNSTASEQVVAETTIQALADKLDIRLMTQADEAAFDRAFRAKQADIK